MTEYIDREKILDCIDLLIADDGIGYSVVYGDDIKKIPAADVAPVVRGRWLTWDEKFPDRATGKNLGVFCSGCENYADYPSNFCPNCGAMMSGGESDGR